MIQDESVTHEQKLGKFGTELEIFVGGHCLFKTSELMYSGDLIQGKEVRQDGRMPPWRRGSLGARPR